MRLLIVEPEVEGHHMVLYTRLILKEAVGRGWRVTILTTDSGRKHAAFDVVAADHDGELPTIIIPDIPRAKSVGSLALLAAQLRLWNVLAMTCKANSGFADFDLIYCINLDYFEKALSLRGSPFGSRPFAGMLMNPKFHREPTGIGPPSRGDLLYRLLFQRLLAIKTLVRLIVIDGLFQEFCLQQRLPCAEKISLVSDVGELSAMESRETARDKLGIPHDAFVVLIYGSLSRRKGVEQLLHALQKSDDNRVHALVAGKPDQAISEELLSSRCQELRELGRLTVRAEFHDDDGEARVFSAADVVWLGYVGGAYGSSGVLYQAGCAGLPVISMSEGLVGWTVRTHKLGISLDATDESAVIEAIQLLCHDETMRQECGENGRRLAGSHTGAGFAAAICDGLAASIAESRGP